MRMLLVLVLLGLAAALPRKQLSADELTSRYLATHPLPAAPRAFANATRKQLFSSCSEIPVLGRTCLIVYTVAGNLTLGLEMTVRNRTIADAPVGLNEVCTTQADLLALMFFVPGLKPFIPLIEAVFLAEKVLDSDIYKVCGVVYNLALSGRGVSGCVALDTNLICLFGSCLHRGVHQFGCFNATI